MAGLGLPTNLDATYSDDGTDASVKQHQQIHDAVDGFVNEFDTATRQAGQVWRHNGTLWVPSLLTSADVGITTFDLTPGGNYTFVLADVGKVKGSLTTDTGPLTWTVPANATTAFPLGSTFVALQRGSGQITIAGGTGVTFLYDGSGPKTAQQGAGLTLIKLFTDQWWIRGGVA